MYIFIRIYAYVGRYICICINIYINATPLQVLSVEAQQILSLTDGLRRNLPRITFEGSDIPLVRGFSSFITMNPGCPFPPIPYT